MTKARDLASNSTGSKPTLIDAKGDLLVGTAADTAGRLAVGTDGHTLVADSVEATGLKWAAPAGSSGPAFSAYRDSSTQSLTAGVTTKVQLNGENYDTDSCFDSTTNYRFTPNKAGYYQINFLITLRDYGAGADAYGYLYKNGANFLQGSPYTGGGDVNKTGAVVMYFNGSSDYVELFALTSGASTKFVQYGSEYTQFSGVWIRS